MRWFSRWFGEGGLSNAEQGVRIPGPVSEKTDSGLVVANERAMQQPTLWACCRLLTENIAATPLHVYERVSPDERQRAPDHFLEDLLNWSPNPYMNGLEFREAMTLSLVLWGNAYAKISRDGRGKPIDLQPLHPDMVFPTREAGTLTYHYKTEGREYILAKESVLHLKGFGLDGTIGLSVIDYARNALGITVSADKYASKAFSTNQRPAGYFAVDVFLTPEQRKQLQDRYAGASVEDLGNWIMEGGTKWHDIGPKPDEVQMLDSRAFQVSELSRFFLIPPHLIGAVDKSTSWGTGIEQQKLGFLTFVLNPYFNRWEAAINRSLLTRNEHRKYYVEHSVEGFLRADSAGRAAFYSQLVQNGILTRNEVRKKENLPPKEGGDDLTVQVNMTPVDQLDKVNGNQNPPNL